MSVLGDESSGMRERTENVTLDQEGIYAEKVKQLRKERGGIKGTLTNKIKEIRSLMEYTVDTVLVESKMEDLGQTLGKFEDEHLQYASLVANDEDEDEFAEEYFRTTLDTYEQLLADFRKWTQNLQQPVVHDDIKVRDSANQARTNKTSSTINSNRVKAEAKKAALLARARALKEQQAVESKRIELKQIEDKLKIEEEIAAAEAEVQVYAEYSSQVGTPRKQADLLPVKLENAKANLEVPKVSRIKHREKSLHEQRPGVLLNPLAQDWRSVKRPSKPDQSRGGRPAYRMQQSQIQTPFQPPIQFPCDPVRVKPAETRHSENNVGNVLHEATTAEERVLLLQQQMLDTMQLPKTELIKFDGVPLRYWMFINAFDNSVGNTAVTDSIKLNRLFQYCSGKALQVIECCSVMNPQYGYSEARRLLNDRFGNQFVISKAWIKKVTEGPNIRPSDNEALQKYADEVRSCMITLGAMGRLQEVDNQARMVKMVGKLPVYLQERWRKNAVRTLKTEGMYPEIGQLVEFIELAAEEANDPVIGGSLGSASMTGKFQKPYNRNRGASFHVQVDNDDKTLLSTNRSSKDAIVCHLCSANHALFRCEKFKQMTPEKRLCFNCFSAKHVSASCSREGRCSVRGRNRKHSRLVHIFPARGSSQLSQEKSDSSNVQSECSDGVKLAGNEHVVEQKSSCGATGAGSARIALPIVPIKVRSNSEQKFVQTYALLDSGSTNTFCSQALIEQLGIKGTNTTLSLTTLEKQDCKSDVILTSLEVTDVYEKNVVNLPYVYSTSNLPVLSDSMAVQDDVNEWPHLHGVKLPSTDKAEVTLLIGQDVPLALTPLEVKCGKGSEPYAMRTEWTVKFVFQTD